MTLSPVPHVALHAAAAVVARNVPGFSPRAIPGAETIDRETCGE